MSIEFTSQIALAPAKSDEEPQLPVTAPTPDNSAGPSSDGISQSLSPAADDKIVAKPQNKRSITEEYQIFREIGHGAQGRIFEARRIADDTIVVVKQLNIDSIKTWKEYELFNREAEVLKSLDFDGVAKFYDAIECLDDDPPCSYIIQEYINGASLQKMLSDGHRFSVENVYDIIIQTLTILDKLHHHEPPIIHRDIKPSNLMISPTKDNSFKVTLIDFGAVANPQIQGGGSTVAGTFGYMPPEQLTGNPVPASDIYAVGALAVQLFSGVSPAEIPVKDFRLIFEPLMQDKPHQLVTTLRQMLEPRVDDRLADIPTIIERLCSYMHGDFGNSQNQSHPHAYRADYEEKLSLVSAIGDAGNINLWQQLPDDEIRSVPNTYQTFLKQAQRNQNDLQLKRVASGFAASVFKLIAYLFAFAIAIAVLAGGIYLGIQLSKFLYGLRYGLLCTLALIACCAGGLILGIYLLRIITHQANRVTKNQVTSKQLSVIKSVRAMNKLIGNSRKTIATITDIKYLPVPTGNDISELNDKESRLAIANAFPTFQIEYRFNPPDDKRSQDIIHKYFTHVEPERHYKIGDQIPILYYIEDHYFSDVVSSVPFPIPLVDFDDDYSIIDQSEGFDEKDFDVPVALDIEPTNDAYLNAQIRKITHAPNMNKLNEAIRFCVSYKKEYNQALMPYVVRYLLNPKYKECHKNCILVLTDMAFPISLKKERVKEAFQPIIQYILKNYHSMTTPPLDVIVQINHLKYCAMEYGFEKDLTDDFYHALLMMMQMPTITDDAKFLIAEGFAFNTPAHIMREALNVILTMDIKDANICLPEEYSRECVLKTKEGIIRHMSYSI